MKLAILLGLMVLLLGCVQTQTQNEEIFFQLGETFTVEQGKIYANVETNFYFKVSSFNDSRCPEGVVCVWKGEQGMELARTFKSEIASGRSVELIDRIVEVVRLAETTKPTGVLFNHLFELISIDIDNGVAELKVTREPNISKKQWFSIEPIQCNGNEWDKWFDKNVDKYFPCPDGVVCKPIGEFQIIIKYFEIEHNIEILKLDSREKYEVVCEACSCARGDEISVLVHSSNSGKIRELGFTVTDFIGCQQDVRVCPNGGVVVREAPFCEFAKCPMVTKEGNGLFIKMFDNPGFVQDRTTVVTVIENDGDIIVESTKIDSTTFIGEITEVNLQISQEEVQELQDFILTTNFFEITEADAQQCIIDGPTVNLTILIGTEDNIINDLGGECDPSKTADAHEIITKIRELIENAEVV